MLKKPIVLSFIILSTLVSSPSYANHNLISLFPLDKYDQTVTNWIKPDDANYDKPLLSSEMQKYHIDVFYTQYFGSSSPWSADYLKKILHQQTPNDLKTLEQSIITYFSNQNKPDDQIGYGANFRPYSQKWIDDIANNIHISQLDGLCYQEINRAIAIDNLHARSLPTDDPHFYNHKLAGQGYPFDNLQMSAIWAGTPLYILAETRDHAWSLVITPDFIAWTKTSGIARASPSFINNWQNSAKENLVAITSTQTSIVDENNQFLFSAYIGTVLPGTQTAQGMKLMVPAADSDHRAILKYAFVSPDQASSMPLVATPHHFSKLMNSMIGRPYGWGGKYFYNDCSAELKSLLTPFGIWLPRHSSDQVSVGKMIDMSAVSPEKRISYLIENGRRFLTIVYIGGHVVMYVGNYQNPNTQTSIAMTYQNVWGLSPNPPTRRAVIGRSVLFPMLLQYPEDTSLMSLAGKKYFQISYLDEVPERLYKSAIIINLRSLMYPERFEK